MRSRLTATLAVVAIALSFLVASPAEAALTRAQIAVRYALAQRGDRYVFGATGPSAWDCSSLVQAAWRRAGVRIPRTTYAQLRIGRKIWRQYLRPGDLVFTGTGHVQMYVGNGYIVEAANPGVGVVRRKMWGFYTARRPVG